MNAALDKYDRNGNGYFEKDELASSLVQYNRTKAKVNASEYSQVMVNASHSSRDARGALRLRLNLSNGHPHEGTSDNICVAMYQIRDDALSSSWNTLALLHKPKSFPLSNGGPILRTSWHAAKA